MGMIRRLSALPAWLRDTFKSSEKTFWGPRGTFRYTRHNFRGLGESLTFAVLGARLVQRAGVSYTDPFFAGAFWSANAPGFESGGVGCPPPAGDRRAAGDAGPDQLDRWRFDFLRQPIPDPKLND